MTLSIISIILSALGLIFVWLLKNIVQSDMNGLRDEIGVFTDRMARRDYEHRGCVETRIIRLQSRIEEALRGRPSFAELMADGFDGSVTRVKIASELLGTIALMDPPVHGFRIVCHRKRYYIEAVRFHEQGGAAFHTELDHEFESYQDADAVVKALLEARSSHKKIVYSPVIIPTDDVC